MAGPLHEMTYDPIKSEYSVPEHAISQKRIIFVKVLIIFGITLRAYFVREYENILERQQKQFNYVYIPI